MKAKKYILSCLTAGLVATAFHSCVDIEPKSMSFLTPENTFVDRAGLETMLLSLIHISEPTRPY